MKKYTVKRTGRTWGVFDPSGRLVEGGFFARDAALDAAYAYNVAASK